MLKSKHDAIIGSKNGLFSKRIQRLVQSLYLTEKRMWDVHIERLCEIAILEQLMNGKQIPHFGRDIDNILQISENFPQALQPLLLALESKSGLQEAMLAAYNRAYAEVRGWFPWLEQNSVDVTQTS